ncbi:MAG TPA: hypothetical protein VES68_04130 [Candidatus Sulfotelmatobacter sp.]|nr:hypothetical protein [Candidatus Sulfotelmatobacter sp.]
MARPESEQRPDIVRNFSPEISESLSKNQQNAVNLAGFLDGSPIHFVNIDAVVPSKPFGLMYSVTLGRVIEEDSMGNQRAMIHKTDNVSVGLLTDTLNLMSKKKRKKHKVVLQNLKLLKSVISDPSNWGDPFNTRGDN